MARFNATFRSASDRFSAGFRNTDVRYQYKIEVYRAPREHLSFDGWGMFNMSDHIMDCVHSTTHKLT